MAPIHHFFRRIQILFNIAFTSQCICITLHCISQPTLTDTTVALLAQNVYVGPSSSTLYRGNTFIVMKY